MPNILMTDEISDTGTINVVQDGEVVRVSGSHIWIDVMTEDSQVRVAGESFFVRVKIEWNGGSADATVLGVSPADVVENVAVYLQDGSIFEWVIEYDNVNSLTRDSLSIRPTPGNTIQQISYTGFAYGASRTRIGFITENDSGVPTFPSDGDVCWIEVGPGNF